VIFSGGKYYPDGTIETGIYIWDVYKNTVKKHAEEGKLNCYFNDHIFYFSHSEHDKEGRRINFFKSGKFGEEEIYGVTVYKRGDKLFRKKPFKWARNKFSCKKNYVPEGMKNKIWIPLLEKHGYLDFGKKGNGMNSNDNVFLHMVNGKVHKLNFLKKDISTQKSQYAEFKKQYFFWDLITSNEQREIWKKNKCTNGWWINPETGNSYSECIPYAPWGASHNITPTKNGLFLTKYNYVGNNPKDSGGYLYTDNQFKKIITGRVRQVKASPDGCKIALTHQLGSHTDLKVKLTLKVVNICNK